MDLGSHPVGPGDRDLADLGGLEVSASADQLGIVDLGEHADEFPAGIGGGPLLDRALASFRLLNDLEALVRDLLKVAEPNLVLAVGVQAAVDYLPIGERGSLQVR